MSRIFLLRLLSFALPFAVLIGSFWLLPMVNGQQTSRSSVGTPYAFVVDERGPFDRTWSWKTTVEISSEPTYVLPRMPYTIVSRSGPNPGGTSLYLDQQVFFNDKLAFRLGSGLQMDPPDGGSKVESAGSPYEIEEVDQFLLHRGINDVEVRVHLWRAEGTTGTGTYSIMLGPVNVEIIRADQDHDGVRDDRQPFPGVHTGLVAVPLALGAGAVGLFIVKRRTQ